jgi:hypothetical protein
MQCCQNQFDAAIKEMRRKRFEEYVYSKSRYELYKPDSKTY